MDRPTYRSVPILQSQKGRHGDGTIYYGLTGLYRLGSLTWGFTPRCYLTTHQALL